MDNKSNYKYLLSDLSALKGVGKKTADLLKKKKEGDKQRGKFKGYATSCGMSDMRQPMIINQLEYESFKKHFAEDNKYIRKEYFPEKNKLWSAYKKGFRKQENIINELSENEVELLNLIKELWKK